MRFIAFAFYALMVVFLLLMAGVLVAGQFAAPFPVGSLTLPVGVVLLTMALLCLVVAWVLDPQPLLPPARSRRAVPSLAPVVGDYVSAFTVRRGTARKGVLIDIRDDGALVLRGRNAQYTCAPDRARVIPEYRWSEEDVAFVSGVRATLEQRQ